MPHPRQHRRNYAWCWRDRHHAALWSPCKQAVAHTSLCRPSPDLLWWRLQPHLHNKSCSCEQALMDFLNGSFGVSESISQIPTPTKRKWSSWLMKCGPGKSSVASPKSTNEWDRLFSPLPFPLSHRNNLDKLVNRQLSNAFCFILSISVPFILDPM